MDYKSSCSVRTNIPGDRPLAAFGVSSAKRAADLQQHFARAYFAASLSAENLRHSSPE
jgi:hypothetical protein